MGSHNCGHYGSFVKNIENEKWYWMDDAFVQSAQECDIVTKSAFILYYVLLYLFPSKMSNCLIYFKLYYPYSYPRTSSLKTKGILWI